MHVIISNTLWIEINKVCGRCTHSAKSNEENVQKNKVYFFLRYTEIKILRKLCFLEKCIFAWQRFLHNWFQPLTNDLQTSHCQRNNTFDCQKNAFILHCLP